jgi:outer membrane protein insertion porin family
MQTFIDRRFASGTTSFVNIFLGQDVRNHPVFPNKGYFWSLVSRVGIPVGDSTFGYTKTDFDATWLTPLIGEYDLVFLLHGHAGIVGSLSNKIIPYRDLYNVGGPGTVRGFEFGQIGPQLFTSSIGAKKAFWINAELIFSITQDQSVRGLVFYDGGAGWDTPLSNFQKDLLQLATNRGALTNNAFRYRHSIGFGIRLLNPAPIRVDWAFKLDRNRRRGESFFEVHFSMNQEF